MPFLLVWLVVFIVWCIFRLKYDVGSGVESLGWVLVAVAMFVGGGLISLSLWSYFFFTWTLMVVWRLFSLLDLRARLEGSTVEGEEVAGWSARSGPLTRRVVVRAAWFHGQILILLVMGLAARAFHHFRVFDGV
jgi:hypothetical protein